MIGRCFGDFFSCGWDNVKEPKIAFVQGMHPSMVQKASPPDTVFFAPGPQLHHRPLPPSWPGSWGVELEPESACNLPRLGCQYATWVFIQKFRMSSRLRFQLGTKWSSAWVLGWTTPVRWTLDLPLGTEWSVIACLESPAWKLILCSGLTRPSVLQAVAPPLGLRKSTKSQSLLGACSTSHL